MHSKPPGPPLDLYARYSPAEIHKEEKVCEAKEEEEEEGEKKVL